MIKEDAVLSLKNDYLFKAVFGSDNEKSKSILMSLLNKILDRENDPIVELHYNNPFQIKDRIDDKETILDIRAATEKEELLDIEMQIAWHKYMPCRLIFYHGGQIRSSLKEGEDYDEMRPTITICITDSVVFKDTDQYLTEFYFMEETSHIKFCNRTKICCIELPKVNADNRPLDELTPLEIYLEYLRVADTTDSEYVKELICRGGEELKMIQNAFEQATQAREIRERAIDRDKYIRDQISWKRYREKTEKLHADTERLRAETETMRAETEEKIAKFEGKQAKIIKAMVQAGAPVSEIANALEYSIEDIEKLLKQT